MSVEGMLWKELCIKNELSRHLHLGEYVVSVLWEMSFLIKQVYKTKI